jgi:hypothetical protein
MFLQEDRRQYRMLAKIERGVANKPGVRTMAIIAEALCVSIEYLIK